MAQPIQGAITNYRLGLGTQKSKECLIRFVHVTSISEASGLIGRKVTWKAGRNKIVGKMVALHGDKGLVRARFRKRVTGQVLVRTVELVG